MENLPDTPKTADLEKKYRKPMRFYKGLVCVLKPLFRVLFGYTVVGNGTLPEGKACFVCGNHLSNWDALFVACAVRRPVHFMAKKQLFDVPVLKGIVKALGAFPVDREAADVGAVKTALTYIKYGETVGIFPQGHRVRDKRPTAENLKSGTGMMVFRTEADVIPVSVYTKGYRVRPFRRVTVTVGEPIPFSRYGCTEKGAGTYERITGTIFENICGALPENGEP